MKVDPQKVILESFDDLQTSLSFSIEGSIKEVTLKNVLDSQQIWISNEQFGVLTEVYFVGVGKDEGSREEGGRREEEGKDELGRSDGGVREGSWRREGGGKEEGGRRVGRREEEARIRGEVSDPIYLEEIKLPRYTPKSLGALIDFLIEIEAVNQSVKFKRLLQEYKYIFLTTFTFNSFLIRIRKINPEDKSFSKSHLLPRKSLVYIPSPANPKDLLESSLDTLAEHFRFWSLKSSFKADWNIEKEDELRKMIKNEEEEGMFQRFFGKTFFFHFYFS